MNGDALFLGSVYSTLEFRTSGFAASVAAAQRQVDSLGGSFKNADQQISGSTSIIDRAVRGGMAGISAYGDNLRSTLALAAKLGPAAAVGLAGVGIATGGFIHEGFAFNSALEQASTKLNAFTKNAELTAETLDWVKKEAAKTQFSFTDMADATAALTPAAKMSKRSIQDLVRQAEVLAALNPAEGLTGAAFAIREALSGDFVSIVERFNLPRQRLNELRAQGVPAMDAIRQSLQEMGVDFDLVGKQGQTTAAQWDQFKDRFTIMAGTVNKPLFDVASRSLGIMAASPAWGQVETQLLGMTTRAAEAVNRVVDAFERGGIDAAVAQANVELDKLDIGGAIQRSLGRLDPIGTLNGLIGRFAANAEGLNWTALSHSMTTGFFLMLTAIDWESVASQGAQVILKAVPGIVDGFISGIISYAISNPLDFVMLLVSLGFAPARVVSALAGVLSKIPLVGPLFSWMFSAFAGVAQTIFGPLRDKFFGAGRGIVQGLLDGAGSLLSSIGRFFLDRLPSWIVSPFKKALGINSPSTVFAGYGTNVVQGLANGIAASRGLVSKAMDGLEGEMTVTPMTALTAVPSQSGLSGDFSVDGPTRREGAAVNVEHLEVNNNIDSERVLRDLSRRVALA